MARLQVPGEKPLHWMGSALKKLTEFPPNVQRNIGFALSPAQFGGKHLSAQPWKGEGSASPSFANASGKHNETMRRDMAKTHQERIISSSGNVFADMGLPDADELDTKARLAATIIRIVQRRRLTQAQVSADPQINQPKVSALLHYKLEGFSVERLMRFLTALGHDVEIVVKAKPRTRSARLAVRAA